MTSVEVPYCGQAPLPADIALRWNFDPVLILALVGALALLWTRGARAGPLTAAGAVLFVLFVSPLCALASALFSVRMLHHVVVTTVAAPLIAFALPRGGGSIAGWTLLQAALLLFWLTPEAYAFALSSHPAYWLMQASLLGAGVAFWRALRGAPASTAVAALFVTMIVTGLAGALLTFAAEPLYAWHATTTQAWGLAPLTDQQLAGLTMWVLGGASYLVAALWLVHGWLGGTRRPAAVA